MTTSSRRRPTRPWRTPPPPRGGDVPPGAGDLPSEYQAVVAGGYDEEALLQQVLEASKADENKAYPATTAALPSRAWW
jgi:hypothetical protein